MATHAPIMGAPTCVPSKIVSFPVDPVALLRLQLRRCRNRRMLDRWTADLRMIRNGTDEVAYAALVAMGAARAFRLSVEYGA